MDLRSGFPLWLVRDGLPYTYPKLTQNCRTDILIIGGGISGALTAHSLINAGIDCIVVDRRTIGLGSTCASTSLLQYQVDVSLSEMSQQIGEQQAARAYRLCADAVDDLQKISKQLGFDYFDRKKTLFYASTSRDETVVKQEYNLHKKYGFDVQYWDRALIRQRFGFESAAALYSNHSAQTDAYLMTHRLLQHNISRGLRVFDRTTVVSTKSEKNKVRAVTDNGFTINARKIIYANGYEAVNYIPKKIVDLSSTYAVASEQLETDKAWYGNCLIWETKQPYLYMRTTTDHRILVGGRDEQFYNPTRRDKKLKQKTKQLSADFGHLFPHIGFEPEFSWTGTFGSTHDGLPYIGECPGVPNALFALGFGGNGITFSVIAASLLTDLLKGKKNRDSNLFSFNR